MLPLLFVFVFFEPLSFLSSNFVTFEPLHAGYVMRVRRDRDAEVWIRGKKADSAFDSDSDSDSNSDAELRSEGMMTRGTGAPSVLLKPHQMTVDNPKTAEEARRDGGYGGLPAEAPPVLEAAWGGDGP